MSELKSLLIKVPDSYFDFVESVLDEARKSEMRKLGLTAFLKAHPTATTSEVLKYLADDLELYNEYRAKEQSAKMMA